MAMVALTCTGLPISSSVGTTSHTYSQHRKSTVTLHLADTSKQRILSIPALRAVRLSCCRALGGSSLRLALRRTERRWAGGSRQGVVSTRCEATSNDGTDEKIPFGYTRKDVILIGLGLTVFGVALKYGLEFFGVDSLRAGNVVQIVMVAGLTIGWISSYVLRVSSKDMTYAKQLKDYENKVMEKRLEELPEAELENMLAQVEEEKVRLQQRREKRNSS